jgi:hypothetical protein
MLPNPVIEVACSTPGGLSGGPAFDKHGKVFGILSVSIDDPDGRGPSQISMIWPALAITIGPAFLERSMPASFRLLDLDDRLCGIDRRDEWSGTSIRRWLARPWRRACDVRPNVHPKCPHCTSRIKSSSVRSCSRASSSRQDWKFCPSNSGLAATEQAASLRQ